MRYKILLRSVRVLLGPDEEVYGAAFLWVRHRLGYMYAVGAFLLLAGVATAAGFEDWFSRVALGVAGAAVALTATTVYRVLAHTERGLVLMDAGRIRQVAKKVNRRMDLDTPIAIQRDTLVTTDWKVDGVEYTVPKASQRAIEQIAAASSSVR